MSLQKLVDGLNTKSALEQPVKLPAPSTISRKFDWTESSFFDAVAQYTSADDVLSLAAVTDVMLLGVSKDKLKAGEVFFNIEAILEGLSVKSTREYWNVIETRKSQLLMGLESIKPPGTTLLRALNTLHRRLDPVSDADFRVKIQIFLLDAFDDIERVCVSRVAQNELAVVGEQSVDGTEPQTESSSSGFDLLLSIEKDLTTIWPIVESQSSVLEFIKKTDELADLIASTNPASHGSFEPLILSRSLFEFQIRDPSFHFKVSAQILLFIEALLLLRPTEIETYGAKKLTRSAVWSTLVLEPKTIDAINRSKKTWFNCMRKAATKDQLEAMRCTVIRDKEALLSKLSEEPFRLELADVNLEAEFNPKIRPVHFEKMGNRQLAQVWKQSLGTDSFITKSEPVAPLVYYEESKKHDGAEKEGYRWSALYLQRHIDWNSFADKGKQSVGAILGDNNAALADESESAPATAEKHGLEQAAEPAAKRLKDA